MCGIIVANYLAGFGHFVKNNDFDRTYLDLTMIAA